MGLTEIRTAVKVDLNKPADQQPVLHVRRAVPAFITPALTFLRIDGIQTARPPFHNPSGMPLTSSTVPFTAKVKDGEVFKVECVDWTGGQIGNNDSADDVKNIDLTKIHYLSGPFEVEGAEPGDVLVVEIQDVQPFQEQPWGFTGVFDKDNGGGFLDELYPNAQVSPIKIYSFATSY